LKPTRIEIMKTLLAFFLLSISGLAFASESCTYLIKNNRGMEVQSITRSSYSKEAACGQANYDCSSKISEINSQGRSRDLICVLDSEINVPPIPPSSMVMCSTDLLDFFGQAIRTFSASGWTMYEACRQSEEFCRYELSRGNSNGYRCVTRGNGNPPREKTESCQVSRFDPAGFFIQSYFATATGPVHSDVKGEACQRAYQSCSFELRGRQTCRIDGR
jgi:hypothetical protein